MSGREAAPGRSPLERGGTRFNVFPEYKDIFWAIVNFLILFWLLSKFLYKPILGMMASREKSIEENIHRAEEANREAQELRQQYVESLAQARGEAQETLAAARKAGETVRDEIVGKAREEAARMVEKAQAAINQEKEKALAELRSQVADLAVMAAGRVINKTLDAAEHRALVADFVREVGGN